MKTSFLVLFLRKLLDVDTTFKFLVDNMVIMFILLVKIIITIHVDVFFCVFYCTVVIDIGYSFCLELPPLVRHIMNAG